MLEQLGVPVKLIPGKERVFKVTTPDDMDRLEQALRKGRCPFRIGQGYDDSSKLRHALECPRRENAGDTAPAHGLTLWRIEYPEFDTEDLLLRNFLL